jgi:hypothetical protein
LTKEAPEHCLFCGHALDAAGPHRTIQRVVRPHMRFGDNKAGQYVDICERDLERRATLMGTMSIDEWEAHVKARSMPRVPVSTGPSSKEMANMHFERMREDAAREKALRATEKTPTGRKKV